SLRGGGILRGGPAGRGRSRSVRARARCVRARGARTDTPRCPVAGRLARRPRSAHTALAASAPAGAARTGCFRLRSWNEVLGCRSRESTPARAGAPRGAGGSRTSPFTEALPDGTCGQGGDAYLSLPFPLTP